MGRIGTWLLVVAVGAIALAATLDAVRGLGDATPATEEETTTDERSPAPGPEVVDWRREVADELETRDVRGTLLWADDQCRVHTLVLPDLTGFSRDRRACRFRGSPGGRVSYGREAVSPRGQAAARCRGGAVEVRDPESGRLRERYAGCAPAWRPDGTLTFLRDGELLGLVTCPAGRCPRVLLSRGDLERALGRNPWALRRPALTEVAWLGNERFAALVRESESGGHAIAVFRGRELLRAPPFAYNHLADLRASPRGTYVAARVDRRGLVVVGGGGRYQGSSPLRGARAVAWSHDEAWTAMATGEAIYVFATGERSPRFLRLGVAAQDVFWR